MRVANHADRAVVVVGDTVTDIATLSGGAVGPDMRSVFDDWPAVLALAARIGEFPAEPLDEASLRCVAPEPRQVFAVGLNYRSHAVETQMDVPIVPATFTKFPSSLSGPFDDIEIVGDSVDWEVELVAVIGRRCDHVDLANAWDHVAGLTVGQDISDRQLQFDAGSQFSLGKSRRGYGPLGPVVVTPDEFADCDDLALGCSVDGEIVQDGRTRDLVVDVPGLIVELSAITTLYPGDVIFTGTPDGVGYFRDPKRALAPGQTLESWVGGIGRLRNRCVTPPGP